MDLTAITLCKENSPADPGVLDHGARKPASRPSGGADRYADPLMEEDSYVDAVLEDCRDKMAKALEHTRGEFAAIRTGRAAPALVEKLGSSTTGPRCRLQQLAGIQVPEAKLMVITPYDKGVAQGHREGHPELRPGHQPQQRRDRDPPRLPPLTEERRKAHGQGGSQQGRGGPGRGPQPAPLGPQGPGGAWRRTATSPATSSTGPRRSWSASPTSSWPTSTGCCSTKRKSCSPSESVPRRLGARVGPEEDAVSERSEQGVTEHPSAGRPRASDHPGRRGPGSPGGRRGGRPPAGRRAALRGRSPGARGARPAHRFPAARLGRPCRKPSPCLPWPGRDHRTSGSGDYPYGSWQAGADDDDAPVDPELGARRLSSGSPKRPTYPSPRRRPAPAARVPAPPLGPARVRGSGGLRSRSREPTRGRDHRDRRDPELPHWTDPPTGEVPRILPTTRARGRPGRGRPGRLASPRVRGIRWRDDEDDWDEVDEIGRPGRRRGHRWAPSIRPAPSTPTSTPSTRTSSGWRPQRSGGRVRRMRTTSTRRLRAPRAGCADAGQAPAAAAAPRHPPGQLRQASSRARSRQARRAPGPAVRRRDDLGSRVVVGVGLIVLLIIAYAIGSKALVVLAAAVVVAAAAEAYGMLQRSGFRPATLLGLVGTVGLVFGAYWKGIEALPLAVVLVFAGA